MPHAAVQLPSYSLGLPRERILALPVMVAVVPSIVWLQVSRRERDRCAWWSASEAD